MCRVLNSDPEKDKEDPKEDPEEDPKEDPEEDLIDYLADGGDDDVDDDESSDDDKDDDDDVEEDEDEEEEEHPALSDYVPPPVHRVTARMSIRDEPPTPFWFEAEIARLLAIPSPPPSPLSPCPTYSLEFIAAMIRQRAESPSTSHSLPLPPPILLSLTRASTPPLSTPPLGTPPLLPIPLPTPSPPLLLPSTDCRAGVSEVTLPPRKRLCIALGPRYEVGESSSAPTARPTGGFRADYGFVATLDDEIRRDPERDVGYGITDTWDEMLVGMPGAPATDDTELGRRMTNFVTTVRQDTDEIYGRLDEAQDEDIDERFGSTCDCGDTETDEYTADTGDSTAGTAGTVVVPAQHEVYRRSLVVVLEIGYVVSLGCISPTKYYGENGPKRSTRANLATTTATTSVTNAQLKAMIDQGVTDALAARDADRNKNGDDSLNSGTSVRRIEQVARDCTYQDFMKRQPLNFKGMKGVFSTCTLLAGALTWWNSHVRTVGHDVAYAMTWTDLKNKMTDKYCPRGEIKKLEAELWNLKVKESEKIERYVGALPDIIHGSVVASKPKTMQEAIEIATKLMDNKIRTFVER
ncbi:putative reverse transcriptase domain-containing protein [Tanacetum coccineum]